MYEAILFNIIVLGVFTAFYFKDKTRAKESLRLGFKSFKAIVPLILLVLLFITFFQVMISDDIVLDYVTSFSGFKAYLAAAFAGAFIHIPLFISVPIGGQLLHQGFDPGFIAVLITSLVMVHTFSIPVEVKEMGLKFALLRNSLSLLFAVIIGILMGVLY